MSIQYNVTFSKEYEGVYFRLRQLAKRAGTSFSRVMCMVLARGLADLARESTRKNKTTREVGGRDPMGVADSR